MPKLIRFFSSGFLATILLFYGSLAEAQVPGAPVGAQPEPEVMLASAIMMPALIAPILTIRLRMR